MNNFEFRGCMEVIELLAEKADNELQLMTLIETVPIDAIYYHTHSYFLRHFYLAGQYPNDFANWAVLQVRDRVLGEKLGLITPSGNKTLEDIREELLDTIDNHLSTIKTVPTVVAGESFYFMKSRIMEIPMGISANNLYGFMEAIRIVHASAIYNHIFEARLRMKRGKSDFSIWLDEILGLGHLAGKIERVDCYMYSLEALRSKILDLCEEEIKK